MKRKSLSLEEMYERVMTSEGHYQVLLELLEKPGYHEELAETLKIGLGTTSDRIANLFKVGLIKKGNKVGRKQYYEVDWENFFSLWKKEIKKQPVDFDVESFNDISFEVAVRLYSSKIRWGNIRGLMLAVLFRTMWEDALVKDIFKTVESRKKK